MTTEPAGPAVQAATDAEGVRWLTLANQPGNLLDPNLMGALRDHLLEADEDRAVRAVVLTGAGESFCGGLDTAQIKAGADPLAFAGAGVELMKTFPLLRKPVLAAVNGDALALGFAIVCACDLAIAVDAASLGCFEATIGLWPMTSQVAPLQRLPPKWVLENVLTGDSFSATRAAEVGIVNRVVATDRLERETSELALRAVRAGAAIAIGRPAFYRFLELPFADAHDQALVEFEATFDALRSAGD